MSSLACYVTKPMYQKCRPIKHQLKLTSQDLLDKMAPYGSLKRYILTEVCPKVLKVSCLAGITGTVLYATYATGDAIGSYFEPGHDQHTLGGCLYDFALGSFVVMPTLVLGSVAADRIKQGGPGVAKDLLQGAVITSLVAGGIFVNCLVGHRLLAYAHANHQQKLHEYGKITHTNVLVTNLAESIVGLIPSLTIGVPVIGCSAALLQELSTRIPAIYDHYLKWKQEQRQLIEMEEGKKS